MTLNKLCHEIRNYFDYDRLVGSYTISGNTITIDELQTGQYFRIAGSVFNDGIYTYPATSLIDEEFDGVIWLMKVPPDVITLIDEITEWETAHAEAAAGPYQSESFGGYSYTRKTSASGTGDYTWRDAFKNELDRWRKICPY